MKRATNSAKKSDEQIADAISEAGQDIANAILELAKSTRALAEEVHWISSPEHLNARYIRVHLVQGHDDPPYRIEGK